MGLSNPSSSSPGRCYAPEEDSRRDLQGICQSHERREVRITKSRSSRETSATWMLVGETAYAKATSDRDW